MTTTTSPRVALLARPLPPSCGAAVRGCATKDDSARSSAHPTTSSLSSSSSPLTPPAVAAAKRTTVQKSAASPPEKTFLFPWRHETAEHPLPRLVPGTPESQYHERLSPKIQEGMASYSLDLSLWQRLVGPDWRPELAESASYAFSQGVAGIVSHVYRIPFHDLLTEDEDAASSSGMRQTLDFRYPMPPPASPIPPNMEIERLDAPSLLGDASSSLAPPDGATTGDPASDDRGNGEPPSPEDAFCPDVDQMLDLPLRKLFLTAHEHGKHQWQIRLQTTPTSHCKVVSLFSLPGVTPQIAKRYPTLVRQARELISSQPSIHTIAAHFTDLTDGFDDDEPNTTIELQVLVECDEIFQVIDRETGQVLQGSTDGAVQKVSHLVRLEMTSTTVHAATFPFWPQVQLGNWIITDLDDLLGPKTWYHC